MAALVELDEVTMRQIERFLDAVDETYLDFSLQALDLKPGGLIVEKLHRLRNRSVWGV